MVNIFCAFRKNLKSLFAVKKHTFNKISKNDKIIFVTRTDLIGDYIVSRDFLRILRSAAKFKDYKIVLLANKAVKDFVFDFDKEYIDEYIELDLKLFNFKFYQFSLFKMINKYKYDYVLNYMSIRDIVSETVIENIKSGLKYGVVGLDTNLGAENKEKYDKMYDKLFATSNTYSYAGLELINCITNDDNGKYFFGFQLNDKILGEFHKKYNKPFAIIFPSASYKTKRMPFEKYLILMEYLYNKYGLISYICGSKADNKIFKNFNINKHYIINLCGKLKLSELPYLFKFASVILTNDTCAMHIGACVNSNIVVFSNMTREDRKLQIVKNNNDIIYYFRLGLFYLIPSQSAFQAFQNNNNVMTCNMPLEDVKLENAYYVIDLLLSK